MLVALLRGNPDAFMGGNVNRIKSGALLVIPTPEAAAAVSTAEATQTITAQSVDFNAFRRKLAAGVPTTTVASADRQASGKVQAKVEDRAPANAIPDKLTLSKGAIAGRLAAAIEEKIAAERRVQESSTRVAELSKNISDLNKLGDASAAGSGTAAKTTPAITLPTPPGVSTPVASIPVVAAPQAIAPASALAVAVRVSPVVAPTVAAASAAKTAAVPAASSGATPNTIVAAASSAVSSTAPIVAASSTAVIVAASAAPTVTTAVSSPSAAVTLTQPVVATAASGPGLVDELFDNPLLLPSIALLIALLGGFAFYRYRQRRGPVQVDSSFLESRLQPDSFFGASGGQRVDTNESTVTGSSSVYSPSQLDAAGDVDPVAEADVYLAYGRDLQAEEILKEAMRTSPMRVAIHAKLMEIYAKRRDAKAFAMIATEAFKLTRGEGPEWVYITEMGRELDPSNPMYQFGGKPQAKSSVNSMDTAASAMANDGGFGSSTLSQAIEPQFAEPSDSVDFDLDLNFSMDEPLPAKSAPAPMAPAKAPAESLKSAAPVPMFDELIMDFGDSAASFTSPSATTQQTPTRDTPLSFETISFTDEAFNAKLPSSTAPVKTTTHDNSLVEFDMGDLSLDLDGPVNESTPHSGNAQLEDPLETKFSLAEEFRSLGDPDGARALAEEVLLEATGPLKVKTQAFLNALS
jgi:pilus assembly protein FimV